MNRESFVGYFHSDEGDFDEPKKDQQAYEAEIKKTDESIEKPKPEEVMAADSDIIRYFHSKNSDAEFAAGNKELGEREQKRLNEIEEYLKKSLTEKGGELGVKGEKFVEKLKEWWESMADKNLYDKWLKDTRFGKKLEGWEPEGRVGKLVKGATKGFLRNGLGLRTAVTTGLALGTASLVFNPVTLVSALMAGDKIALATLFGSRRAFAGLGAGIATFVGAEKWAQARRAKKTKKIGESLLEKQGEEQESRTKKDEIEKMTDEQLDDYLADLSYEDREKNSQLIDILIQEKAKRFAWLTDREKSGISEEQAGEMLENWMEGAKGKLEDNFKKAGWSRAGRVVLGAGMTALVASGVGGRIIRGTLKGAWRGGKWVVGEVGELFGGGDSGQAGGVLGSELGVGGRTGGLAEQEVGLGGKNSGKVEASFGKGQASEVQISGDRGVEQYAGQRLDALVSGEDDGIITVLRRQLEAQPEMFGYVKGSGMSVTEWAEKKANNIAFNEGYGDVLVKEPGKVSYVLGTEKGPDGKIDYHIKEVDYATGKEIGVAGVIDTNEYQAGGETRVNNILESDAQMKGGLESDAQMKGGLESDAQMKGGLESDAQMKGGLETDAQMKGGIESDAATILEQKEVIAPKQEIIVDDQDNIETTEIKTGEEVLGAETENFHQTNEIGTIDRETVVENNEGVKTTIATETMNATLTGELAQKAERESHSLFADLWQKKIKRPDKFIERIEKIKGGALTGEEKTEWLKKYNGYKMRFSNKIFKGRESLIGNIINLDVKKQIIKWNIK